MTHQGQGKGSTRAGWGQMDLKAPGRDSGEMKQKREARLVTVWVDGKMSRFREEEGSAAQLTRVRRVEHSIREDCRQGMNSQWEEFQGTPQC